MKRFNIWYDGIQEPWRLLLMLAIVLPGIAACSSGVPALVLAGGAWLIGWIFVRMFGA